MGFFSFLIIAVVAYLVWRISDQLPDIVFRITEIQRDVADIRKRMVAAEEVEPAKQKTTPKPKSSAKSTTKSSTAKSTAKPVVQSSATSNDAAENEQA